MQTKYKQQQQNVDMLKQILSKDQCSFKKTTNTQTNKKPTRAWLIRSKLANILKKKKSAEIVTKRS